MAVLDPGEPAATLGDAETGVAIRDHIGPWTRRHVAAIDLDAIVQCIGERAEAIALRQRRQHDGIAHLKDWRDHRRHRLTNGAHGGRNDLAESNAIADDMDARHGAEERNVLRREDVGATNVDAAWYLEYAALARRHHHRGEPFL